LIGHQPKPMAQPIQPKRLLIMALGSRPDRWSGRGRQVRQSSSPAAATFRQPRPGAARWYSTGCACTFYL